MCDDVVTFCDFFHFCASLVHHPPASLSARSAAGCVVHRLGFLPTTSPTRDDETRRIDGSAHDILWIVNNSQTGNRCSAHNSLQVDILWKNNEDCADRTQHWSFLLVTSMVLSKTINMSVSVKDRTAVKLKLRRCKENWMFCLTIHSEIKWSYLFKWPMCAVIFIAGHMVMILSLSHIMCLH